VQADGTDASAESDDIEVRVVTASVSPQERDRLTSSVSVISADEIDFLRYDNVTGLLRLAPGVHMEQPGSRGGRSSIYLRGLDPNQTVILVDGIRMGDPNNNLGGSFDLSTLDTDSVERIEIVRGPLSAVHGSDALAGAINIITRTGREGDQLILDGSGGRYGYGRGLAIVRGQRGIFDASISGSFVDDGKPEADSSYRSGSLHASFGAELPHDAELRATLRFVDARSRAYPEASGGEKFAVIRKRDERKAQELGVGIVLAQRWNEDLDYQIGVTTTAAAKSATRLPSRRRPETLSPPFRHRARTTFSTAHE
jgi:outer membrane cobalamin receptor